MTCIIGMIDNGKAYMGADRRVSFGNITKIMPAPGKITNRQGVLLGSCGTLKFNNIIKYHLLLEKQPTKMTDEFYVNNIIIEEIRKITKDKGVTIIKDNEEIIPETMLLLIHNNKIYYVGCDLSVLEESSPYYAIGSGGELALGALSILEASLCPEYKIIRALEVAAKYDSGVGGPFDVYELGSKVFKTYKNSEEVLNKENN